LEPRAKQIRHWIPIIEQGQIRLPRFQRHEAWKPNQIIGLLENVLRDPPLPIGSLLVLEVGSEEPFHSRPIVGAPQPTERATMHLLDGQQRLTALWRSLTGNYDEMNFFLSLDKSSEPSEDDSTFEVDQPPIEMVKRWDRKGTRQPVWADDPVQTYDRRLMPVSLLLPGNKGEQALNDWLAVLKEAGKDTSSDVLRISKFRERVASYNIPFLSLEVGTGRETALNVFIKMNTSASPLKDFDIVVAQLEEATGEPLHEMVEKLLDEIPEARAYGKIEDIVLSMAALLSGKAPLKKSYLEKSFGKSLAEVWPDVTIGLKRGISFLRDEAMFNEKCLPTDVAVYLVCALWAKVPKGGYDQEGNARTLIRKALWRACFTDRYVKTSATRAFADFKALSEILSGLEQEAPCELFNEELYPLPEKGELLLAGWPSRKDRLPRAILAVSLRAGGIDFADGSAINNQNVNKREYHHLFPVKVLGGDRDDPHVNRALNCALIAWRTNRGVGGDTPKEYINERTAKATLGEDEVRRRLKSHLISYDKIIEADYGDFLSDRADMIAVHMKSLCDGAEPQ
jgi:hypothetical protein